MRKVQAGTLESSDCMVVVEENGGSPLEKGLDLGNDIFLEVSGAGRFQTATTTTVRKEAEKFGISGVRIFVQGSALDVVLAARLEAAFARYRRT